MITPMTQRSDTTVIHHYDDEPHNISSLRDNLLFLVMRTCPDAIDLDEVPDDDEETQPLKIVLHLAGGVRCLEYRIYPSSEEFCNKAEVSPSDIVLLDAFERGPQGEPVAGVKQCLDRVFAKVPKERVFLVSAFTSELDKEIKTRILPDNIIRKPFDVNEVAQRLLKVLGIVLQNPPQ